MIRINLLPVEERKELRGLSELVVGVLLIIAVLVVILATHYIQAKNIRDVKHRITTAEKRIVELEEVKKMVEDFKAKNNELRRRIEIIKVLEENRTGPLYVMDSLATSIPDRAWINKFSEKGRSAKIEGVAWNEFTVSDFMKELQSSPYFINVELGNIKKTSIRTQPVRTFIIKTLLNYSGKKQKTEKKENNDKNDNKQDNTTQTKLDLIHEVPG